MNSERFVFHMVRQVVLTIRVNAMKQMTLAIFNEFEVRGRAKRKAALLPRMKMLVPWAAFYALISNCRQFIG